MNTAFQLNPGWVASIIAAILFDIHYPLALAVLLHRRMGVSWRYFGYGALIFFLFQLEGAISLTIWRRGFSLMLLRFVFPLPDG